ncbi:DUF6233 domain-containing protein [Streptomyces violascens]|uniref:DUF6233 domain-containing protein n=1 Tax=Streptomyces violascens TaxID=67381 RepID=UPI0036466BD4
MPELPRPSAARLTVPAPAPPPVPITLLLPDGQTIERVRLYERQQLDTGLWMYRIGVPLWQTSVGGGAEPTEYDTWVTSAQLRPIPGIDLSTVPTTRRPTPAAPAGRWAWVRDGRTRGRAATLHAEGCTMATDRARPLSTTAALDTLARPGTAACTGCAAAETLLPILRHGQTDAPGLDPGD